MTQRAFFGFDVGTSSTKAVLVDERGKLIDQMVQEHAVTRGVHGLVEMDMNIWWTEFRALFSALMSKNTVEINGIGISGMGPCVGMTTPNGTPLAPAALYGIDWRAREEIAALTQEFSAEKLLEKYDSTLTSQAGGPKIGWFASRYPTEFNCGVRFFMPFSFIIWHITGEYVLDRHSASQCTPLYDAATQEWDTDMAVHIGGDKLELPRLGWSNEICGTTQKTPELPELKAGIPVIFGTIDAWAEQESVGATDPNHLFLMYGTTLFLIANTENRVRDASMWGTTGTRPGTRNLAGGLATSGALTNWFRDISGVNDFAQLIAEAEKVPAGANGLLSLPYFAGERTPIQDADARGVIAGLTLDHTRGHVYRSLLESTAFAVRHNIETMQHAGATIRGITCAGGGTKSALWPQIISDVTGLPQIIREETIGASFGDAFMVAQALGCVNKLEDWNPVRTVVQPQQQNRAIYDALYADYRKLYESTADIQHRLAEIQNK
ncbi:MAG: FGGY family carbohydrate kinase [Rothia sp. (in: high G+C Gram-positive bacteria)]|nr:FGGY family carbohydrate kinase [Rothia sp. (in: high G+C Gram-positive bacteria)]